MQHLLPLYLVLCILPGIAALTVLSVLALRVKNKGLTYYLISYCCFTVSVIINLVMFYLSINISEEISFGIFMLISLGLPFSVLMQTTLPLAVNTVTTPPGKRWIDLTILLIGTIELALYCTPLLMHFSRETRTIIFGPIFPYVGIIEMLLISYSIGMIVIRRKAILNPTIRKYSLTLVAIVTIFLPALGYDQSYFKGVKSIDTIPIAIILSPLFYVVLSLATLFFGIRAIMSKPDLYNQKNAQEIINQKLFESARLSEREITIVHLIARGLGNKQIALELDISSKTVGNHIYNIYRKLNITSRYELLSLVK